MFQIEGIIVILIIILCLIVFYYLAMAKNKKEKLETPPIETTTSLPENTVTEKLPITEFGNDFDDGYTFTKNESDAPTKLMTAEQNRINKMSDDEVAAEVQKHQNMTYDQFLDNMTNGFMKYQNRENLLGGSFQDTASAGQFFELNKNMPLRKYRENWNLYQNDRKNAYTFRQGMGNFWQAMDGMEYQISMNTGDEPEETNRNILSCFDQSFAGNY
jgi:hypothetical protein